MCGTVQPPQTFCEAMGGYARRNSLTFWHTVCFVRSRLIGSDVKKSKEYGMCLALILVEKVPHALDLTVREGSVSSAAGSSNGGGETRSERLGSEAIAAARGLPETHDVVKLSERLVKAIERPGGVVAMVTLSCTEPAWASSVMSDGWTRYSVASAFVTAVAL